MKGIRVAAGLLVTLVLTLGIFAQEASLADADVSVQVDPGSPTTETSPAVSGVNVLRIIRFSGTARGAQGQALAGTVGVTFALYEEQEARAPLWLETQSVSLDRQGRYTVLLGATSNEGLPLEVFSSGEARWLGIQVQGQAEQRVLLVSVPYALKAAEAETLSGKKVSDFVLTEQLSTQVEEEISTQIEEQGLVTSEEAGTLAQVSGSGTVGQIAKFTSPTAVGNSVINENNGNIAIGFSNALQKLAVGVGAGGGSALNLTNLNNQDLQVVLSAAADPDRVALVGPATPTNLALGVGGTERMRITNAGNIGIGFKTPVQRLVVASRPSGGPTVTVTNGANQDLQLSVSGRNAADRVAMVAPSTGTNLALGVGGTERMRITNAGSIGIGTVTPQSPLHIVRPCCTVAGVLSERTGGSTLKLFATSVGEIGTQNSTPLHLLTNNFSRIFIDTAGDVGIGTTSPAAKLDVAGTSIFSGNVGIGTATPQEDVHIVRPSGTTAGVLVERTGGSTVRLFATSVGLIGTENSTPLHLVTGNFSRIFVSTTGDVGIDTTSPADKLHVNGEVRVTDCVKNSSATQIAGSCVSDVRFKKDIEPFGPALDRVAQLEPVHFSWRVDEFPERAFGRARSYGLIAQQVETVLPELVSESEDGYKRVNYSKLPLLMLQAIRELKAEKDNQEQQTALLLEAVEQQQAQLRDLQAELQTVKARLQADDAVQVAVLEQE